MYKELLDLHTQLESPFMNMNPLLYANQNPVFSYPMVSSLKIIVRFQLTLTFVSSQMAAHPNPQYRTLPAATETIEILDD